MQRNGVERSGSSFSLRIKIGEYEVELCGNHRQVLDTAEVLPDLISKCNKAFESSKNKTIASITIKNAEGDKSTKIGDASAQSFPKIKATADIEEAILNILESDWGKWRPRTEKELKEALLSSDIKSSERQLASTLNKLSKKGTIKHWNTNTDSVYILAEQKVKTKGE